MENTNINTPETQEGQVQETTTIEAPKTFTESEMMAEVDRRIQQYVRKEQKRSEERVREAEKLAQMNEAEKFEYQLQQREAAIAEKERELTLMENKNEASKILAEKGLSLSLVDFVVAEDAETMADNIRVLDNAFQQSVKNEVEKRLASKTPRKNLPLDKEITRKEFLNMKGAELAALRMNNPQLFDQLSKQR